MITSDGKTFLFLQGPHGPFFARLGDMLTASGAQVWRVGFNRGDKAFWPQDARYIAFQDDIADWPQRLAQIIASHKITDIVLYGDTRAIHAEAIVQAKAAGLTLHIFEEGYLRPYWITYERDGANGHSPLMHMSVQQMRAALEANHDDLPDAPARWGDMRQHMFYGMLYHFFVLALNHRYLGFRPHRALSVMQEFRLYLRRLALLPVTAARRWWATRRVERGGFPYHICLLQLDHDASFIKHSPFASMSDFLDVTLEGFARGAPRHHHLVFKAHPLEDGRVPMAREIMAAARRYDVAQRVHYIAGGKLARLLNMARSAVTVNSTAAQQALWRGLPVKAFGRAVFNKPGLTSEQPLHLFFNAPSPPDQRAYRDYRRYLLETCQIAGGFYSARGRRQLLRSMADLMLSKTGPYETLRKPTAPARQQLRIVR